MQFNRNTTKVRFQFDHVWSNVLRNEYKYNAIEAYWLDFHKLIYIAFKVPNTLPMYNKKQLTCLFIFLKCNVCGLHVCMCINYIFQLVTPKWFQHLLPFDVLSFIAQDPYWSQDATWAFHDLNYYFNIFLNDHVHKAFPFRNHMMEFFKNIYFFLK